jgi:phosphatidylglycerol---prolipoprotein diacylglyceryl transferase
VHPILFHIGPLLIPTYGAMAAVGVLTGLVAAQRTARIAGVAPAAMWNLCVVALSAALVAERILLIVANWGRLRNHPRWLLGLGTIHHPLVAGVGVLAGVGCGVWYARSHAMPLDSTSDAVAGPLALGLVFEQMGALMAGSSYGVEAGPHLPWAVTYASPAAALSSGTPLGVRLHPVQAYLALAYGILAILLLLRLPRRRQPGEVAGLWLLGAGVAIDLTELWRDPEGRGLMFKGAVDAPQIGAVLMVLAGALVLRERKTGSEATDV